MPNGTRPITVAIAEDSPEFLSALASLVAESGAAIAGTASTANAAIQLVAKTHPDVLLLDVFLSQGTGLDVLKRLRGKHTLTVMMTNSPSAQLERQCADLGAFAFFDKADTTAWVPQTIGRAAGCV